MVILFLSVSSDKIVRRLLSLLALVVTKIRQCHVLAEAIHANENHVSMLVQMF